VSKNPKYEGDDEQTVLARLDNPHTSLAQRRLKKLDTSLFVLGDLFGKIADLISVFRL